MMNRVFLTNLLIFKAMLSVAFASESERALIQGTAYTEASLLVEVEPGRRLNLYCIGEGSPTVIFESGLAEPINNWGWVQPLVARTTKACSYDRAGVGFSDPISGPSTATNIVDDLHTLLTGANIAPPYVLVGHSTGGLSTRLYAHTYPHEVIGMVLVDPSDENQVTESRKLYYPDETEEQRREQISAFLQSQKNCMNEAKNGFVPGTALAKKCKFDQYKQLSHSVQIATNDFQMKWSFWQAQVSELENFYYTTSEQLRSIRMSFGDMPIIVLTETRTPPSKASEEELALWKSSYKLWQSFHIRQARLSKRGIHEIVPGAGHHIPFDRPEVVENAILRVLNMAVKTK